MLSTPEVDGYFKMPHTTKPHNWKHTLETENWAMKAVHYTERTGDLTIVPHQEKYEGQIK